jgi:hypothetical protein
MIWTPESNSGFSWFVARKFPKTRDRILWLMKSDQADAAATTLSPSSQSCRLSSDGSTLMKELDNIQAGCKIGLAVVLLCTHQVAAMDGFVLPNKAVRCL